MLIHILLCHDAHWIGCQIYTK